MAVLVGGGGVAGLRVRPPLGLHCGPCLLFFVNLVCSEVAVNYFCIFARKTLISLKMACICVIVMCFA